MQSTGYFIRIIIELTARMEPSEDKFHTRHLVLRVLVDGHSSAIVYHLYRPVSIQRDFDFVRVPGDGFIYAIVHDLLYEMIRSSSVRIHPRPSPHWFQT